MWLVPDLNFKTVYCTENRKEECNRDDSIMGVGLGLRSVSTLVNDPFLMNCGIEEERTVL